jgi:hypothetical protein
VIPAVLGAALAALALWILRPLRAGPRRIEAEGDGRWKELVEAKHALYRSILDLELDRSVGKVSGADYEAIRGQQEAEALTVLAEMDVLASGDSHALGSAASDAPKGPRRGEATPDTLEAEIAAARARLRRRS